MALFERFIYFGCKTVALLVDEMLLPLLKDFATAAIQIGHSSFVACVDGGEDGLTQEHLLQYDTVFDRLRGDGIAKALVRMLQNPALLPLDAAVGACHPNSDCMGSFGILIETVLTSIGALTVLRAEPASMEGSSSNMDPMQLSAMYAMFASCDRRNIGALSPADVTQVVHAALDVVLKNGAWSLRRCCGGLKGQLAGALEEHAQEVQKALEKSTLQPLTDSDFDSLFAEDSDGRLIYHGPTGTGAQGTEALCRAAIALALFRHRGSDTSTGDPSDGTERHGAMPPEDRRAGGRFSLDQAIPSLTDRESLIERLKPKLLTSKAVESAIALVARAAISVVRVHLDATHAQGRGRNFDQMLAMCRACERAELSRTEGVEGSACLDLGDGVQAISDIDRQRIPEVALGLLIKALAQLKATVAQVLNDERTLTSLCTLLFDLMDSKYAGAISEPTAPPTTPLEWLHTIFDFMDADNSGRLGPPDVAKLSERVLAFLGEALALLLDAILSPLLNNCTAVFTTLLFEVAAATLRMGSAPDAQGDLLTFEHLRTFFGMHAEGVPELGSHEDLLLLNLANAVRATALPRIDDAIATISNMGSPDVDGSISTVCHTVLVLLSSTTLFGTSRAHRCAALLSACSFSPSASIVERSDSVAVVHAVVDVGFSSVATILRGVSTIFRPSALLEALLEAGQPCVDQFMQDSTLAPLSMAAFDELFEELEDGRVAYRVEERTSSRRLSVAEDAAAEVACHMAVILANGLSSSSAYAEPKAAEASQLFWDGIGQGLQSAFIGAVGSMQVDKATFVKVMRPLLRRRRTELGDLLDDECLYTLMKRASLIQSPDLDEQMIGVCSAIEKPDLGLTEQSIAVQEMAEVALKAAYEDDVECPDSVTWLLLRGVVLKLIVHLRDQLVQAAMTDETLTALSGLIFDLLDGDGSGSICWQDAHELKRLFGLPGPRGPSAFERLRAIFDFLDSGGDGKLSPEDIAGAFERLVGFGLKTCALLFDAVALPTSKEVTKLLLDVMHETHERVSGTSGVALDHLYQYTAGGANSMLSPTTRSALVLALVTALRSDTLPTMACVAPLLERESEQPVRGFDLLVKGVAHLVERVRTECNASDALARAQRQPSQQWHESVTGEAIDLTSTIQPRDSARLGRAMANAKRNLAHAVNEVRSLVQQRFVPSQPRQSEVETARSSVFEQATARVRSLSRSIMGMKPEEAEDDYIYNICE